MITLKKYLDMDSSRLRTAESDDSTIPGAVECYRSALKVMGSSAVQACPHSGAELEERLQGLDRRLATDPTASAVKQTEELVEAHLQEWGRRTSEHFKAKVDEVKDLLMVLAKTAESVVDRDQKYTTQFADLTVNLNNIANLDDLTQVRSSLVKSATELKICVDRMAQDSEQMVSNLRAEVSNYESRLKVVEQLVLKDPLTGLSNRRSLEERIRGNIENNRGFTLVMIDLNHFKWVNDTHGHLAGDDLLKQFAAELQTNVRSSDMVGRFAGDEFLMVLACNSEGARSQIQRLQKWVFGKYEIKIEAGKKILEMQVDGAVGLAEWRTGESMQEVIDRADAEMLKNKQQTRGLRG